MTENWVISIEECARRIAEAVGWQTVQDVLRKYGARGVKDLQPYQYDEVFSELYAIDADLK